MRTKSDSDDLIARQTRLAHQVARAEGADGATAFAAALEVYCHHRADRFHLSRGVGDFGHRPDRIALQPPSVYRCRALCAATLRRLDRPQLGAHSLTFWIVERRQAGGRVDGG